MFSGLVVRSFYFGLGQHSWNAAEPDWVLHLHHTQGKVSQEQHPEVWGEPDTVHGSRRNPRRQKHQCQLMPFKTVRTGYPKHPSWSSRPCWHLNEHHHYAKSINKATYCLCPEASINSPAVEWAQNLSQCQQKVALCWNDTRLQWRNVRSVNVSQMLQSWEITKLMLLYYSHLIFSPTVCTVLYARSWNSTSCCLPTP